MNNFINHVKALKEYKFQTLQTMETWIKVFADNSQAVLISDLEMGRETSAIPGTERMYFRLIDNAKLQYSIHVLKDVNAVWDYLAKSKYDEFAGKLHYFYPEVCI